MSLQRTLVMSVKLRLCKVYVQIFNCFVNAIELSVNVFFRNMNILIQIVEHIVWYCIPYVNYKPECDIR